MRSPYLDSFEFDKDIGNLNLFKVLVLPSKFYKGYVAHFISDFVQGLIYLGWYIIDSENDIKSNDIGKDIFEATGINKIPDVLAFYILRKEIFLKWKNLKQFHSLKIVITEDIHRKYDIEALNYSLKWVHAVFTRYPHSTNSIINKQYKWFNFFLNYRKKKIFYFNLYHGATDEFIRPIDFNTKKNKVLLSGAINSVNYELRSKAKNLMNVSDKIILRQHPGYKNVIDSKQEASNYALEISNCKITIADQGTIEDSEHPYVLAKHFEIPASGTAMLTHKKIVPYIKYLGFEENINFIATTPDSLMNTINYWLLPENEEKLMSITQKGQELVVSKHLNKHRITFFNNTVVKLLLQHKIFNKT
jgi:hypothetical protein